MKSHKQIFITGTGTNVGKTVISAALATGFWDRAHQTTYWKPIQAGLPLDTALVANWAPSDVHIERTAHQYTLAAAPDQAAAAENEQGANLAELRRLAQALPGEIHLIEGAGGLLVPLNQAGETWADLLVLLKVPVILVASTGLGTLNSTCLTVEALQQRKIPLLCVVLSGRYHQGNIKSLHKMLPHEAIYRYPHMDALGDSPIWRHESASLADFVVEKLNKESTH